MKSALSDSTPDIFIVGKWKQNSPTTQKRGQIEWLIVKRSRNAPSSTK